MSSTTRELPASPCVRNCCLDDGGVCIGCGRALQEIVGWSSADVNERTAILARSRDRLAARLRTVSRRGGT